ncbi:MAG: hypothetical protein CMD46_03780 [Gammaproteobacteria bacterium]|nr:hypothetical protein [Gammaproteobacteria bacterium]|tara:strand:+ start:7025 stop:7654 length:630 start_codon:yes stop_codon:yes gene_type:complete
MLHKNLLLISLLFFTSLSLGKSYEININFESGFEYKSQKEFVDNIHLSKSKKEMEYLINDQDWIKKYSIRYKPFSKKVFINIANREPIFIFNETYFYDRDLNKFNFDQSKKNLIMVKGPIDDLRQVIKLINIIESTAPIQFKINSINYSYVNGWDIKSKNTLIRFGNELTKKRFNNYQKTVNYLLEISKIPSIIDVRYKDGVALNYGKQ